MNRVPGGPGPGTSGCNGVGVRAHAFLRGSKACCFKATHQRHGRRPPHSPWPIGSSAAAGTRWGGVKAGACQQCASVSNGVPGTTTGPGAGGWPAMRAGVNLATITCKRPSGLGTDSDAPCMPPALQRRRSPAGTSLLAFCRKIARGGCRRSSFKDFVPRIRMQCALRGRSWPGCAAGKEASHLVRQPSTSGGGLPGRTSTLNARASDRQALGCPRTRTGFASTRSHHAGTAATRRAAACSLRPPGSPRFGSRGEGAVVDPLRTSLPRSCGPSACPGALRTQRVICTSCRRPHPSHRPPARRLAVSQCSGPRATLVLRWCASPPCTRT